MKLKGADNLVISLFVGSNLFEQLQFFASKVLQIFVNNEYRWFFTLLALNLSMIDIAVALNLLYSRFNHSASLFTAIRFRLRIE